MDSVNTLTRLLQAQTTEDVEAILSALPITSSDDYQWDYGAKRLGEWRPGQLHWIPVGLERGNSGRIKLAGEPTNPLAERLVNGMEALIEHARLRELANDSNAPMPLSPRAAALRYFNLPPLDEVERMDSDQRKIVRQKVDELRLKLTIRLNYHRKSKQFAVAIRDEGMGQMPDRMHKTLLSLGQSDKADKPYLVGVFGQGGSSTFAASEYSVIVTRRAPDLAGPNDNREIGWSIVRQILPRNRRDVYFAYLAADENGTVPCFAAPAADKVGFDCGSHFAHINYDFGGSASAVTRLLYQALNHVLFNPVLPYDLYSMKDKPELMQGTAQRLARQVRLIGRTALQKSYPLQAVG